MRNLESHQPIILVKVTCWPYLPSRDILLVSTSFSKIGENLASDGLGEQQDSVGELVRTAQNQTPSDACHTSGETLSAQNTRQALVLQYHNNKREKYSGTGLEGSSLQDKSSSSPCDVQSLSYPYVLKTQLISFFFNVQHSGRGKIFIGRKYTRYF